MSGVTQTKKPRYESQKRLDKKRSKTRICIGDAFERWRQLKAERNLKTDADMAHFLLDNHVKGGEVVMLECLLQLFYKCCNQCSINTKRDGRFLYERQRCHQCHRIRVWRSHPLDHINSSPAASQEAAEETVLSSFEDTESEEEEEVRGRNMLIQSWKGNIESKEIGGLHRLSSLAVGPVADLDNMRTDTMNDSVILTPDALDSRSDGQEDVDRKDGCNSTHQSELEESEAEDDSEGNEDEEMEDSDDDSSCDDDAANADWDLPAARCKELPASETDSTCSNADPDSESEVLLPLVWCCVCESGFKNNCFKQRHCRLYGCIKCGIKKHKQTETEVTNNNQRTSSDQETSNGNNYNISDVGRHYDTHRSDQYNVSDGNQDNGSRSKPAVFTSNNNQEVSSNNGGKSTLGTKFFNNNDTARNGHQEEASCRSDERESDEEHARSLHIENLGATFESLTDFKAHVVQCHGITQFRSLCTDCGKFITMVNMVDGGPRHICEHKAKPIICSSCGKRFTTEFGLIVHVKTIHTERYILSCRYCAKTFKSPKDKEEHEESHQGQKLKYHCPDCPQQFPDRPSWRSHWKRHWPNGKHVCEVCNKGFYNDSALIRHMRVHTGVKPYICELCDRPFSQPDHLKSHMRVHTGEKPFMCHECGLCFNHNVSLKNHVQRYHGPRAEVKKGKGRGRKKKIMEIT